MWALAGMEPLQASDGHDLLEGKPTRGMSPGVPQEGVVWGRRSPAAPASLATMEPCCVVAPAWKPRSTRAENSACSQTGGGNWESLSEPDQSHMSR
jgi:hypothetical protein